MPKSKNPFGPFPEQTNRDAAAILEAVASDGYQKIITRTEEKLDKVWLDIRSIHDADLWRKDRTLQQGIVAKLDEVSQLQLVLEFLKSLSNPDTWQLNSNDKQNA